MKRFLIILLSFVAASSLYAQTITFEEPIHDFGSVREEKGPVAHEFTFKNTGDKPLIVNKVVPACGCTVPGWTKSPVQPGGTGVIKATYTPIGNKAMPFSKTLTVTSNAEPSQVVLTIKGNFVPVSENIRLNYRDSIGNLRLKYVRPLNFPQISMNSRTTDQKFEVANVSETDELKIEFENVPDYIIVTSHPAVFKPKERGSINIRIEGNKRTVFGYTSDKITIKAGESRGTVTINSVVAETFPKLSGPDWDNGPRVTFGSADINLHNVESVPVEITNEGKSELIISSYTTDNPNLYAEIKKGLKIKAGKSVSIKIGSKDLQKSAGNIYLTTNDPRNSLIKYKIINK
jgi:hypothetical protein